MQSILFDIGVGVVTEIGDRSQFLLFVLSLRYRRPLPVTLGMLLAAILTHGLAGLAGDWVATAIDATLLRWAMGLLFLAMAAWALVPRFGEKIRIVNVGGVFLTVVATFFLVEIGDKSNIAAAVLSARTGSAIQAVIGTVIGVAIVNIPVGIFGPRLAEKLVSQEIGLQRMHCPAAILLAALGLLTLAGAGPF